MNTKQKVLLFLAQTTYKLHDWIFTFMARSGLILFGGGDSGGPTSTTTTTSNIPEYARPYFERLMDRTEAASNDGYVGYGGQRVQPFSAAQTEGMNRIGNMRAPSQIADATSLTHAAAQGAMDTTDFKSGYIGSTYRPQATQMQQAPSRVNATFDAGGFDGAVADRYMSPYQQRVTDIAKREAIRGHQIAGVGRDSQAAQRGSFGGSRAGLVQAEADRNMMQQLDDIQMKGSQSAFENAQQQYERDRAAQYQQSQQGLDAGKFNSEQELAYGKDLQAWQQYNEGQRQKAAEMGLQGQTANEAARATAAGIQQKGVGMAGEMAGQLGNLGKTQQELDIARARELLGVGSLQQQQGQKALDTAYDDFVNQRDYDKQQLNFYSGVLRGVPTGVNSDVVTRQQAANPVSQIAGLGIAGLGAYGAMKQ